MIRAVVETSLCSMGMFTQTIYILRTPAVETSLCSMGMFTLIRVFFGCAKWKLPFFSLGKINLRINLYNR